MEELLSAQLFLSEREFLDEVAANTAALAVDTGSGRIVHASGEAERLLQCKVKNGLNGMAFEQFIPPELREKHLNHVGGYLRDPHSRAMGGHGSTLRAQSLNGNQFPVAISLRPVKKADRLYVILTIVPLPRPDKETA